MSDFSSKCWPVSLNDTNFWRGLTHILCDWKLDKIHQKEEEKKNKEKVLNFIVFISCKENINQGEILEIGLKSTQLSSWIYIPWFRS